MNKFNLDIQYNIPEQKDVERIPNEKLTQDYINYCVANVYEKGLAGQLRRIDGRLKDKIQNAINDGVKVIELESDEIKHLVKCVEEASVPTGLTSFFNQLEEEVDKLTV